MSTADTSIGSATTATVAPWTLGTAVRRSTWPARGIAGTAALAALVVALATSVPLATGVTLAALVPAGLVDVIDRRLPNRMIAAAAGAGLLALLVELLVDDLSITATDPLLGALAMAGPLLVIHLAVPTAIGFGDVKLAVVAGAALGVVEPIAGLVALAVGSAGAAIAGVVRSQRTVAFGPGLLGGALVTLMLLTSAPDSIEQRTGAPAVAVHRTALSSPSHGARE